MNRITLERVHYIPKDLQPGTLYVSEEFGAAMHLCACGCGEKISTPLAPTEWSLKVTREGPSLFPSVGNWQKACKSHYIINRGRVIWCEQWTPQEIAAGRLREEERRRIYYNALERRDSRWARAWAWIRGLFRSV